MTFCQWLREILGEEGSTKDDVAKLLGVLVRWLIFILAHVWDN